MATERVRRKISAILSADIAGYSRLMEADEETTVRTIESYRESVSAIIEQHNGRVVDSPGDNLLAEFGSVVDAVQCAVEVQHVIRAKNAVVPEARRMEFRVGISLEDVIEEGDRIYGDGVNIASRIEGLADAGGICISGAAYEQIKRKLALGYEDLGEHSVKNISWPVQVYRIPIDTGHADETRKSASQSLSEKSSIAVLPFENMSDDPKQEYFADGMTDEIITRLSMQKMFTVISRNSTFFYKGKPINIRKVGEELGARYVVEGSVRKSASTIRVTAQLIEAPTDKHLWAKTYDRELKDTFTLQDEVAQQIVKSMGAGSLYEGDLGPLREAERARAQRIPTEDSTAYDSYLRGIHIFWAEFTKGNSARAREYFEKAIELDTDCAMAYVGLGLTHESDYIFWMGGSQSLDLSFEAYRKAISLDDTLSSAHALLANNYKFRGEYELALAETERAISLNPSDSTAYAVICSINNQLGKPEKALEAMKKAMLVNPLYDEIYITEMAWAYRGLGRYTEAIASLNEARARRPDYVMMYWEFGHTYLHQWITQQSEDPLVMDKALEMVQKRVALDETSIGGHLQLSTIHLWRKEHDEAVSEAAKAIAMAPKIGDGYAALADVYNFVGRIEEAIELAEKAARLHPASGWPLAHSYRLAGRLEESVAMTKRPLASRSDFYGAYHAHKELTILYDCIGREEKARAEAAELLELVPNFSVDVYGERIPYKDPAQTERDMAALRKAGLK